MDDEAERIATDGHREHGVKGYDAGVADDIVALTTVQGPVEELSILAFLDAHGIPHGTRRHATPQHAMVVDGMGAVTILVPADRVDEARCLLAEMRRGDLELPADEDSPA